MKVKAKLGMDLKKSKLKFLLNKIIGAARKSMVSNQDARKVIKSALKGAREAVKKAGGKRKIKKTTYCYSTI